MVIKMIVRKTYIHETNIDYKMYINLEITYIFSKRRIK